MSRLQDVERLGHAIKDAEARLKVFIQSMDAVNKELLELGKVENALVENITFLKTKNVIALANEYKKAKDALLTTRQRMAKIRIDADRIGAAHRECEAFLLKSREDLNNTLIGPNNILKFRRKDAKK